MVEDEPLQLGGVASRFDVENLLAHCMGNAAAAWLVQLT